MESQPFSTPSPSSFPPSDASGGSSKVTPSGLWYVLAGVLAGGAIVACIGLIVASVSQYSDEVDSMDRIDVPGEAALELEAGEYTVYYETDNGIYLDPDIDVDITGPDGADVPVTRKADTDAYVTGRHEGEAIYTFDAPEPGTYQFVVGEEEGVTRDRDGNIAVGEGPGILNMVGRIVLGVAIAFVGMVAGIVIVIVVGIKRGKNKRRLNPYTPPPPPPGWGYPPPGGMPPPPPPST